MHLRNFFIALLFISSPLVTFAECTTDEAHNLRMKLEAYGNKMPMEPHSELQKSVKFASEVAAVGRTLSRDADAACAEYLRLADRYNIKLEEQDAPTMADLTKQHEQNMSQTCTHEQAQERYDDITARIKSAVDSGKVESMVGDTFLQTYESIKPMISTDPTGYCVKATEFQMMHPNI